MLYLKVTVRGKEENKSSDSWLPGDTGKFRVYSDVSCFRNIKSYQSNSLAAAKLQVPQLELDTMCLNALRMVFLSNTP